MHSILFSGTRFVLFLKHDPYVKWMVNYRGLRFEDKPVFSSELPGFQGISSPCASMYISE